MSEPELRARERMLDTLADRLSRPHPKPFRRRTLAKPQSFVFDVGDVVCFPVMRGFSANPYCKDWATERPRFEPDAIGAAVFLDRGQTFGYLAWYFAAMLDATWPNTPSIDECIAAGMRDPRCGTLSATHVRRMAITKIGTVRFHATAFAPSPRRCDRHAVSDISLSNNLNLRWAERRDGVRLRDLLDGA